MTTAFTAIPPKMTMSTRRGFGLGMADSHPFRFFDTVCANQQAVAHSLMRIKRVWPAGSER